MDIGHIQNLLKGLESDLVEFKADLKATEEQEEKDHVVRTVTAFYNTRGGRLLFGIKNKTGEVIGIHDAQRLEENFFKVLRAKVPSIDIFPTAEVVQIDGKQIVVVTCPKGPRPPYTIVTYDTPFVRSGSSNVLASDEQIAQMYRDRSIDPQDRLPVDDAELRDMDTVAAERYLTQTSVGGFAKTDNLTMMVREGLATRTANGDIVPTIAGLLLFGKTPQAFLPQAVIKADVKRAESVAGWDDIQTFGGTIFDQIQAAESFIKRYIPVVAKVVGFRRIDAPMIPYEALREAIVNALVHRDYQDASAEIHLRVRSDGVSVINPGGLMPPLTIEIVWRGEFAPRTRNATLADALIRLGGYMDKRGSGIDRMKQSMCDAKLPPLELHEEGGAFRVVFRAPLFNAVREQDPSFAIDDRELADLKLSNDHFKILELIEGKTEARPGEVAEHLGLSRPSANKRLDELVQKRVLTRLSKSTRDPNVVYRLHSRFSISSNEKHGLRQATLL